MRAMLVGGTQVATYDQFKQFYAGFGITGGLSNTFCSAMSAGLIYSVITAPFETAKNKMASQKPDPKTGKLPFTGTMQTSQIADGWCAALWSGFVALHAPRWTHGVDVHLCGAVSCDEPRTCAYRRMTLIAHLLISHTIPLSVRFDFVLQAP